MNSQNFSIYLKIKASLVLMLLVQMGFAQEVFFCEGYTDKGEAKGAKEVWELTDNGAKMEILYHNGKTTFDYSKIFFLLETEATETQPEKLELKVNQHRNWAAITHTFTEPGHYRVSVYGNEYTILASKYLTIKGEEKAEVPAEEKEGVEKGKEVASASEKEVYSPIQFSEDEVEKVKAYQHAQIQFLDKSGRTQKNFQIENVGAYVELLVEGGKPIGGKKVTIDVWKKENGDYTTHLGSKKVEIKPSQEKVKTHYSFQQAGEYKISVFDQDFTWICSGYLRVLE